MWVRWVLQYILLQWGPTDDPFLIWNPVLKLDWLVIQVLPFLLEKLLGGGEVR